ncbi:conserved hypothetical protein [Coccidioides posadasii str. Silveira]|uniref:Uncharacterized protein n=1 Tax=Coccidioides posadasii (strain RMSCC 757 / Silveira) TaxID=443226 RepID=E9CZ34_COCPS|nr:conserved hypothetical protein [Coccidioides posadasii str. Silveira]
MQAVQKPVTARERASIIKKAQEDALARLPLNTLFIVLYIRSDPPQSNDFHWGYYFHTSAQGGLKYHMRNLGGGWFPDHGPTGAFSSPISCASLSRSQTSHTQSTVLSTRL